MCTPVFCDYSRLTTYSYIGTRARHTLESAPCNSVPSLLGGKHFEGRVLPCTQYSPQGLEQSLAHTMGVQGLWAEQIGEDLRTVGHRVLLCVGPSVSVGEF